MSSSLGPHGLQPARLFCPWDSPGKNTGVSSHFLPRPRAQTHASRIGRGSSSPLSHQGSPGSEFGVPSGQGMVRCCRMGSRAGACVSPGPSDMALSAPSWARCSHRHDTLETGGSPAGSSQCGQGNRPGRPQDGGSHFYTQRAPCGRV